ncbi:tyrosine-type recombinase/integrase [Pseudomonas abietaniphila]|uniref:Phage integrase family protein n=1 Tax=Pseudomonas abietaniphila TaxID=89065 RepID=A0A1G8PSF7_9PSED|nr:tyrosine-type recombinase/integrase [Pseudomonas abietaniphila]SDI94780.1 Phage integrase family protein [Pseudomonas abietaniphila]
MSKYGEDSFQDILDEIEREARDAADAYFSDLYNACHGAGQDAPSQRLSGLLTKLAVDPDGEFPVSEYSVYSDGHWVLLRAEGFKDVSLSIENSPSSLHGLKRVICYHLLPAFNPTGTVRSFRSSSSYAHGFKYMEKFLFSPNYLGGSAEDVSAISATTLNEALDDARDSGVSRAYVNLFFLSCFWIFLSSSKIIPLEYQLDVKLGEVDTVARRQDIQEMIRSTFVGWKPYSDDELKDMLSYAFFWIDKGIPVMQKILSYAARNPDIKKQFYLQGTPNLTFERLLGKRVDGVEIVGFSRTEQVKQYESKKTACTTEYTQYRYSWRQRFAYAVDRVRNAIFILCCTMTGLRKRELAPLQFDDVSQRSDGLWYLSFVRYKTSDDPNYFGEADEISLPSYLGEAIESYKQLRQYDGFMMKGYLFQPVIATHELNLTDRMITKLAINLSAEVGVDGLHVHRFRKTIAEILINRSERNIDLVRMIFGHSSYVMGMRYISRNPFLVSSVVETLKEHFAKDFVDILSAMSTGVYAGETANELAAQVSQRPDLFVGKILKTTVLQYVTHMFEGGEAFMVQRTALRTFCMSGLVENGDSLPPCLAHREKLIFPVRPDVTNCQIQCSRNLVLESAASAIEQNLKFYRSIKVSAGKLSQAALFELDQKIAINEKLLDELSQPKPPSFAKKALRSGKN